MAEITSKSVKFSAGTVCEIEISRPESLNALNEEVLQGILDCFEQIAKHSEARVVTITGSGEKAFVAGADISTMSQLSDRAIADYVELGQRAMRAVECCRVPVIAVVNGYALGGGLELALACDIMIGSSKAKLGQPEVNLGVIPGFGGTQRLVERCGIGTARKLIFTGEIISAQEAQDLGILDQVVEPDELLGEAQKLAETIAAKGPLAVAGAKEVLRARLNDSALSGLRLEVEKFLELFRSADRAEGMQAFLEKREPKFNGR